MVAESNTRKWVEYFEGQSLSDIYSSVEYTKHNGQKVEVPVADSIEKQIAEIYRTNGKKTQIILYLKEDM